MQRATSRTLCAVVSSYDADAGGDVGGGDAGGGTKSDGANIGARCELLRGARVWPGVTIPDGGIRYSTDV